MKFAKNNLKQIKFNFQNAVDLQQNCKICIFTTNGDSWSFYFKKGNLIWASSSIHRFRRLYRLTNQICPQVNCQEVKLREQEISELWEYLLISVLYKRKQIDIIQVKEVIQAIIKEVLFDCFIAEREIDKVKVFFKTKGNKMGAILNSSLFQQPITKINYIKTVERIESFVSDWNQTILAHSSPNLAPVIKHIDKLKKTVDGDIYQQLFVFINGKKTLRDLAIETKKDLITVANLLIPQIKSKAIALQRVPDQQLSNLYFAPSSTENDIKYNNGTREYIQELDLPLIICVDDDPHICQQIAQVLNPIGYRILPVNDGAKTLMVLLKKKPNLILIDAEMPDINGYELCAQIKKMPDLKNIPLIIIGEQDSIVDKLRGKISGAVDIISKPLNSAILATIAQKYTQSFADKKSLTANK
ncbi:response regulator [Waterburya agarophytonicola K14]|uniref:Response regulator n=1 Tax=Waterburya agarophytonicola KI4 TaxID=2874699 RepID=A0A964FI14_9CYAN|nr:response regulator [Waterburya agarophytonicola]MCC0177958.1 response regulator [Waterburya agarophytonicola KI4]